MFDIKSVQEEAEKEIQEELIKKAKTKIKDKLRAIAAAKQVLANLHNEYEVLLKEIGSDVA